MATQEKRLVRLFNRLPPDEREMLLAFADFLVARCEQHKANTPRGIPTPNPAPRPGNETVVAAIRRLSTGYPMLDKPTLLNETSTLMTDHVLRGRKASDVIDKLEALFQTHYERIRESAAAIAEPTPTKFPSNES